jgi:hypothetical protein
MIVRKPVQSNVRVESEVLAAEAAGFELLSVFEAWGRVKKRSWIAFNSSLAPSFMAELKMGALP